MLYLCYSEACYNEVELYVSNCLIKFPFKRKACQVYRVGKGRGRAGQGRAG